MVGQDERCISVRYAERYPARSAKHSLMSYKNKNRSNQSLSMYRLEGTRDGLYTRYKESEDS